MGFVSKEIRKSFVEISLKSSQGLNLKIKLPKTILRPVLSFSKKTNTNSSVVIKLSLRQIKLTILHLRLMIKMFIN